jgi:hypothetical protein
MSTTSRRPSSIESAPVWRAICWGFLAMFGATALTAVDLPALDGRDIATAHGR